MNDNENIVLTKSYSFAVRIVKLFQHLSSEKRESPKSLFYEGDKLTDDWATSSFGYGSAISSEMTGIEDFVRIDVQNTEQTVSYKAKRSRENGIAYSGHFFFNVFDFTLKDGRES